jgi:hypothetical protein
LFGNANPDNTLQLAENAVTIAAGLKKQADDLGIPAAANQGASSSASSQNEPTPAPMTPMQKAQFGGGLGASVKKYGPLLLLAGGAAYYFARKKKGKR